MEPTNSFIYALDNLRRYIRKVYGKTSHIIIVPPAGSVIERFGNYFREICANMGKEETVVMLYDDGYSYLNYPNLDVEVCFTPPATGLLTLSPHNLVLTGECDAIDLKDMFPNVKFAVKLHKKDDNIVSLMQFNLVRPALSPFPSMSTLSPFPSMPVNNKQR